MAIFSPSELDHVAFDLDSLRSAYFGLGDFCQHVLEVDSL
jgi:hypothetical protein